ncbi:MAG TPA: DUF1501 domain-containing protein [Candidatus Obscuribacterales bacterium]
MTRSCRRSFLRQIVLGHDSLLPNAGASTLVCVFLRGGADTLNMIVPYADDRYYNLRPTIAIPSPKQGSASKDRALKLDDLYAFHPKMAPLYPAFAAGRLGIVQGVGSDNPTGSHFEAQDQMEHGEAFGKTVGGGWLARHLRTRAQSELTPLSAVAIGATIPEVLRGAPNASAISSLDDVQIKTPSSDPAAVSAALSSLYGADVDVLSAPGRSTLTLLKRVESLRGKTYRPTDGADYPEHHFGQGLKEIARLIKADVGLEIACIDLDGWDTHFVQGGSTGLQAENIEVLAQSLAAFDKDMDKWQNRVTVLVLTEFGRRIYENGSLGTDHGRGFAAMALGARVSGGKIHGAWPGLSEEKWVLGPSGLQVVHDYRSILSEVLAGALGNDQLDRVFPGFRPQPIGLVPLTDHKKACQQS